MDNILLLAAILVSLYAFMLFKKTDKWDYFVYLITKDKRKLAQKRTARSRRFMLKLNER